MNNLELEERTVQSISRWTRIPADVVRKQRGISRDEAIRKYLSDESRTVLEKAGYKESPQTHEEKLNCGLALIAHLGSFRDDFYRTEEGKLWYDCNVPDMARVACELQPVRSRYKHIDRMYAEEIRNARMNATLAMRNAGKF